MDPKPDYVASVLPFSTVSGAVEGYTEGAQQRFRQACQDDAGFDLIRDLPFRYKDRDYCLRLRLITFDSKLRGLPFSQVYRAPLLVLPSLDDELFDVQCDALATALASSVIPGATQSAYNTLLSSALRKFKSRNPDQSHIQMPDLVESVRSCAEEEQLTSKKTQRLVDALKGYATENSSFYANTAAEVTEIGPYLSASGVSAGQSIVPITVFDISGLPNTGKKASISPQASFVSQVCGQIYNHLRQHRLSHRPVQLLLVLDEARNYLPNPTDQHSYVRRLVHEGASLGVKIVLISQSPQDIEMEARKQMKTYIVANIHGQTVRYVVDSIQASGAWTQSMGQTGSGRALILGHEVRPEGYALCQTFTSPQFVGLIAPDQLVRVVGQLHK
jgi:hypothetical protein